MTFGVACAVPGEPWSFRPQQAGLLRRAATPQLRALLPPHLTHRHRLQVGSGSGFGFAAQINQANGSPKTKKAAKAEKKAREAARAKLTKGGARPVIGGPTNFVHCAHVGADNLQDATFLDDGGLKQHSSSRDYLSIGTFDLKPAGACQSCRVPAGEPCRRRVI